MDGEPRRFSNHDPIIAPKRKVTLWIEEKKGEKVMSH
jgi:hypothetical protein